MEINNLKTIRGLAELQSNSTKNKTMGYGELISFYRNFAIGSDFIFFTHLILPCGKRHPDQGVLDKITWKAVLKRLRNLA